MEEIATVAVLIDADSTDAVFAAKALDFADGIGSLLVTRAYGDWSDDGAGEWVSSAPSMGVKLVQAGGGPSGVSLRIAVDAMEMLYTTDIDVVCIVSVSGDYSAVVTALRENSVYAVGIGAEDSPEAFRRACSEFAALGGSEEVMSSCCIEPLAAQPEPAGVPDEVRDAVLRVMRESDAEDGWVFLGGLTKRVSKILDGFDAKEYGGMKEIAKGLGFFDFDERAGKDGRRNLVFVRFKDGMRRPGGPGTGPDRFGAHEDSGGEATASSARPSNTDRDRRGRYKRLCRRGIDRKRYFPNASR